MSHLHRRRSHRSPVLEPLPGADPPFLARVSVLPASFAASSDGPFAPVFFTDGLDAGSCPESFISTWLQALRSAEHRTAEKRDISSSRCFLLDDCICLDALCIPLCLWRFAKFKNQMHWKEKQKQKIQFKGGKAKRENPI